MNIIIQISGGFSTTHCKNWVHLPGGNRILYIEFWKKYNIKIAIECIKLSCWEVSSSNVGAVWKYTLLHCENYFLGFSPTDKIIENITSIERVTGFDVDTENV